MIANNLNLFQVSVSPSLGSLPSNTVNTTGPNTTHISLTFENSNGTVLARLDMASNLTLSLASTKCQVCLLSEDIPAVSFLTHFFQGNVVDNFCCTAAADASKCKGVDKWKYAGMVVKDKVCLNALNSPSKVTASSKVFADVVITGKVTTSAVNKTIAYKRADGDKRINSTEELTLTVQYTG